MSRLADWARKARADAGDRLAAHGWPEAGIEYWKFTPPGDLVHRAREFADTGAAGAGAPADRGGMLRRHLSRSALTVHDLAAPGQDPVARCSIAPLAAIAATDESWARDIYGQLEGASHEHVPRHLACFNTAHAVDGYGIHATGPVEPILLIDYGRESSDRLALHRNVVRVEADGNATMLEFGASSQAINRVLEVDIAAGGTFHHVQVQDFDALKSGITYIFARLGAGACFKSFTISTGQALCRNESFVTLAGAGGRAHIAGAAVGGSGFHHDDTVFVTHDAPDCESRQVFKKVLNDGAVGVFQGKILVNPDAQKTDGYQLSQALLMDDSSQFLAKPELEIYADDVACSHGSTCGSLEPDSLFYLRSRGIPLGEARDILALGFLNEALREVEHAGIADILNTLLARWLIRGRG